MVDKLKSELEDKMNTKNLIEMFREYYCSNDYTEIVSKSLISNHDSSIRFTNSTSSVMKPFFINERKMNEKLLLIQPAMGCQGIDYWINNRQVDRFSSYFLSFGIMGPFDEYKKVITQSVYFFLEILKLNKENFVIQYNEKDAEFVDIIENIDVLSVSNVYSDDYYIHHFGVERLIGKTICYTIKEDNNYHYIGSVILLEQDGIPVAVEHSFDSTLLLAGMKKGHPVLELPGICKWNQDCENLVPFKERIGFFDLLFIACVLVMEGLKPGGRGRRRNLRKVLEQISIILDEYKFFSDNLEDIISDIYDEEMNVRNKLNRIEPLTCTKDECIRCISKINKKKIEKGN